MKPALFVLLALAAMPAAAEPRPRLISMQIARAHALAMLPQGRVRSGELEREHGRLIYSFDIQLPNRPGVEELQIDAVTGRLVARHHESPAAERQERRRPHR